MVTTDTVQPEKVAEGDAVIVSLEDDGSGHAARVFKLHDRVMVTEEAIGERRAVLGTVKSTGTEDMVVETERGGSTFVVRPEKLFPPLPTPGDKVGVIYRVQELAKWDRALADELVLLPDGFELPSAVEISYERTSPETSQPAESETQTAPSTPESETRASVEQSPTAEYPETDAEYRQTEHEAEEAGEREGRMREELPQTAGHLASLGLAGLVALSAGLGLRSRRRRS